jgi:hypothetical protein
MNKVYAGEPLEDFNRSVFLAGPTPRSNDVPSWRPDAIKVMEEYGDFFDTVYIPEPRDGNAWPDYDANFDWEIAALERASSILFWVPRDLETMPAFTTNVEFGYWVTSRKCVLGYPEDCPGIKKNRYLAKLYALVCKEKPVHTLKEAFGRIVSMELF